MEIHRILKYEKLLKVNCNFEIYICFLYILNVHSFDLIYEYVIHLCIQSFNEHIPEYYFLKRIVNYKYTLKMLR